MYNHIKSQTYVIKIGYGHYFNDTINTDELKMLGLVRSIQVHLLFSFI